MLKSPIDFSSEKNGCSINECLKLTASAPQQAQREKWCTSRAWGSGKGAVGAGSATGRLCDLGRALQPPGYVVSVSVKCKSNRIYDTGILY